MDFGVTGKSGGYCLAEQYRKNAAAEMKMQYECRNLAGYASYQKIPSAFDTFMDKD